MLAIHFLTANKIREQNVFDTQNEACINNNNNNYKYRNIVIYTEKTLPLNQTRE